MPITHVKKPGRPKVDGLQVRRCGEILDVATRLFAERGYPDTDIDSVAADLKVAKGTIYRYFPSKRELFLAAVERGVQDLQNAVHAHVDGVGDPIDRIVSAIHTYLSYFDSHPELVELFVQERAYFKDRRKPAYFAQHDANFGRREGFCRQLIAEGRLRELSVAPEFDVVNDFLYGTVMANYFTGRMVSVEKQAASIVDILFNGILSEKERRRWQGDRGASAE